MQTKLKMVRVEAAIMRRLSAFGKRAGRNSQWAVNHACRWFIERVIDEQTKGSPGTHATDGEAAQGARRGEQ